MEHRVGHTIGEICRVNIVRRTQARHTDSMRPHAETCLQVLGMHQQPNEVIAVCLQPEQHPDAHVVNAARHGAVHGLGVIGVIMFRPRGVQSFIVLPVIRLLKQDVRPDAGLLQLPVILHRGGSNVHVHPPDGPVPVLDAVNRADTLQHILYRVAHGVFARLQRQPFVSHVL